MRYYFIPEPSIIVDRSDRGYVGLVGAVLLHHLVFHASPLKQCPVNHHFDHQDGGENSNHITVDSPKLTSDSVPSL